MKLDTSVRYALRLRDKCSVNENPLMDEWHEIHNMLVRFIRKNLKGYYEERPSDEPSEIIRRIKEMSLDERNDVFGWLKDERTIFTTSMNVGLNHFVHPNYSHIEHVMLPMIRESDPGLYKRIARASEELGESSTP